MEHAPYGAIALSETAAPGFLGLFRGRGEYVLLRGPAGIVELRPTHFSAAGLTLEARRSHDLSGLSSGAKVVLDFAPGALGVLLNGREGSVVWVTANAMGLRYVAALDVEALHEGVGFAYSSSLTATT